MHDNSNGFKSFKLFSIEERNEARPDNSLGIMPVRYNPCLYGLAHGHDLGVC